MVLNIIRDSELGMSVEGKEQRYILYTAQNTEHRTSNGKNEKNDRWRNTKTTTTNELKKKRSVNR